jgi:hypothetical protein
MWRVDFEKNLTKRKGRNWRSSRPSSVEGWQLEALSPTEFGWESRGKGQSVLETFQVVRSSIGRGPSSCSKHEEQVDYVR